MGYADFKDIQNILKIQTLLCALLNHGLIQWNIPIPAQALCLSIFNLSPKQKTCLFTNGNKANMSP